MRRLLIAVLASVLMGCASTPRGNAENWCNFLLFSAVLAMNAVAYAGACTFGLEVLPNEEDDDEEEE